MQIKTNKKNEVELCFTWKEVWTMIKERKLTMDVRTLDNVTGVLINMRYDIMQREKREKRVIYI
jgi:hypothetical protein